MGAASSVSAATKVLPWPPVRAPLFASPMFTLNPNSSHPIPQSPLIATPPPSLPTSLHLALCRPHPPHFPWCRGGAAAGGTPGAGLHGGGGLCSVPAGAPEGAPGQRAQLGRAVGCPAGMIHIHVAGGSGRGSLFCLLPQLLLQLSLWPTDGSHAFCTVTHVHSHFQAQADPSHLCSGMASSIDSSILLLALHHFHPLSNSKLLLLLLLSLLPLTLHCHIALLHSFLLLPYLPFAAAALFPAPLCQHARSAPLPAPFPAVLCCAPFLPCFPRLTSQPAD